MQYVSRALSGICVVHYLLEAGAGTMLIRLTVAS